VKTDVTLYQFFSNRFNLTNNIVSYSDAHSMKEISLFQCIILLCTLKADATNIRSVCPSIRVRISHMQIGPFIMMHITYMQECEE